MASWSSVKVSSQLLRNPQNAGAASSLLVVASDAEAEQTETPKTAAAPITNGNAKALFFLRALHLHSLVGSTSMADN